MESADERVIIEQINLLGEQMNIFHTLEQAHARKMIEARNNRNCKDEVDNRVEAEKFHALYLFACEQDTFLRRLVGWN